MEQTEVPLFISRRRLARRSGRLPVAICKWGLDSGGFSELSMYGEWRTSQKDYIKEVKTYITEIGNLEFAAQQDWMCEPFILAKTGKSVSTHQLNTITNYIDLKSKAPALPWMPVIQGFTLDDYMRCVDLYYAFGIDLRREWKVGIGSICRREGTLEIRKIVHAIAQLGIPLHCFGMKEGGLTNLADEIASADSMAWSAGARRGNIKIIGHKHRTCANCIGYALHWREKMLQRVARRYSMLQCVSPDY